ncbi:MAG: hypothetical protein R3261_01970 [Alphaproteobacteria bacterium]|nr:hypothetical protein [Alphaproteobacteria bacterium]
MGFLSRNLSVIAYANGFTFWHYTTEDSLQDFMQDGYFNHASDMLRKGDCIICNGSSSANLQTTILNVVDNSEGIVRLSSMLGAGASGCCEKVAESQSTACHSNISENKS